MKPTTDPQELQKTLTTNEDFNVSEDFPHSLTCIYRAFRERMTTFISALSAHTHSLTHIHTRMHKKLIQR